MGASGSRADAPMNAGTLSESAAVKRNVLFPHQAALFPMKSYSAAK